MIINLQSKCPLPWPFNEKISQILGQFDPRNCYLIFCQKSNDIYFNGFMDFEKLFVVF